MSYPGKFADLADYIRTYAHTIEFLVRDLDKADVEERVAVGCALHNLDAVVRGSLDKVKDKLRGDATPRFTPGSATVSLHSSHGAMATVTAPSPIVRPIKGANIEALRAALGDDFGEFFEVQTTLIPKQDAMERILQYPEPVQRIVFSNIEQDVGVGGVGFSRRRA